MLIEAGVFKFQITQSFFYDVDTTSAKNRRSVKLNLENNRLTEKRDNRGPRVTNNAAVIDKIVQ
jgi:hypothetical protein